MENKKNKSKLIRVLLIILGVILVLIIAIFAIYKVKIDVSDKHIDNFDYDFSENVNNNYSTDDFFDNDIENGTLTIKLPKSYLYNNFIDMNGIKAEFKDSYGVDINKIGYRVDESNPSNIDLFIDFSYTYNPITLNSYAIIKAYYTYDINDGFKLYFKDMEIGDNLPKSLYNSLVPYKENELLYERKSSELINFGIELLDIEDRIQNFSVDNDGVSIEYVYIKNANSYFKDLYENISNQIKESISDALGISKK